MVLCVPFENVAPKPCPESEEDQTTQFSFIEGELIRKVHECAPGYEGWKYYFSYDDEQVLENYSLVAGDVLDFECKNCVDKALEQKIGSPSYVFTREEDGAVVFVNEQGCEYIIIAGGGG